MLRVKIIGLIPFFLLTYRSPKMGAGFVILFWLIVAAIYFLVAVVLSSLFLLGWFKKWIWLRWLAGLPAAGMLLLAVVVIIGMIVGIALSQNPKNVFRSTFNENPSSEVSDIQSSLFWFADTGSVYLRFHTTESEFRRLVPEGLVSHTSEEMRQHTPIESGFDPPKWWMYQLDPRWIYFLRCDSGSIEHGPARRGFYSETEYFAFDPATQTAYYRFLGID